MFTICKSVLGFFLSQFITRDILIYVLHHIFLFLTGIEKASSEGNKSKMEESRTHFCRHTIQI